MKELLLRYPSTITTPLNEDREMDFNSPDPEFSNWGVEGTTLHLKLKECGRKMSLKWDGYNFEGSDPRGGYSVLRIHPLRVESFRKELRGEGILEFEKPQEIEKAADVAVISEHPQNFGDVYKPVPDLKEFVNELFLRGYKAVYLFDCTAPKNYEQSSKNAQDLLNCHFLNMEGTRESDDVLDLHACNYLNNCRIPVSTWMRIKGMVANNKKNFVKSCEEAAAKLELKTYAFSKSRKTNNIPNDASLKNFKVT